MIKLGELVLECTRFAPPRHCSVSAIPRGNLASIERQSGTYIAKGLEPPAYKKRAPAPAIVDPFEPYLRERLATCHPALTAVPPMARDQGARLRFRAATASCAIAALRDLRPIRAAPRIRSALPRRRRASRRRSTSPSSTSSSPSQPGLSASSGSSRWCSVTAELIWGRFVVVTRTCRASCAAISPPSRPIDGIHREILYDRMKTAVIGEDADGLRRLQSRACIDLAPPLPLPAARLPALSGPRPRSKVERSRSATSARTSSSAGPSSQSR